MIEARAEKILETIIQTNVTYQELLAQHGLPIEAFTNSEGCLVLSYLLAPDDPRGRTREVVGFSALLVSNRVAQVRPILGDGNSSGSETDSDLRFVSFKTLPGRPLVFHALQSDEEVTRASLGQIPAEFRPPDTEVAAGKYARRDHPTDSATAYLFLDLGVTDMRNLRDFTRQNVGKQMSLSIGTNLICAPFIRSEVAESPFILTMPRKQVMVFEAMTRN